MENVRDSSPSTALAPSVSPPDTAPQATSRTASGRIARWVLSAVVLCNLVVGGAVWAHSANTQAAQVGADLRARLNAIQVTLAHIDLTQPSALASLSTQITPARADMELLINTLPFGGRVAIGPWVAAAHALAFGIACADAAQAAISTAIDLEPALTGLRDSVLQGTAGGAAGLHLLTLSDVHAAQSALQRALNTWYTAQAARAALSPSDIAASSLPGFGSFVQRFDQIANSAALALATASAVLDFSPALLGLSGPGHLLLLESDPDVARPTGGRIEHYGVLTFNQGALSGPIQLESVAPLDCPQAACPAGTLPPSDTWSPVSATQVQLRDASLDPELQTTGYVLQRDFTQESGVQILGIIVVTPALAADILGAIGPVAVSTLHTTFTAANAQALISYYHRNPVIPVSRRHSVTIDVDALLTQAIVGQLPHMALAQRTALGRALVQAIETKDIQFYTANTRVESELVQAGAAGSVAAPAGDSLYLVDTNVNGVPAAPFVHERASDSVTLDAEGGATHMLRVTYAYDRNPQGLPPSGEGARYTDVVRVVTPNLTVNEQVVSGCALAPANQSYHTVFACQFSLMPGQQATLTLSWYVPHAFTPPNATGSAPPDYRLLVQRQPGSQTQMGVVVIPPTTAPFVSATTPGRLVAGQLEWTAAPLTMDTALEASFAS